MANIDQLNEIKKYCADNGVKLIAVSKTKPVEEIKEVYDAGQKIFGENKVQELTEKQPQLPQNIEWHMIGHLQRNKVKYIVPFVDLIHSVDSERLLNEINKQAGKEDKRVKVLLQVHIADEETKFGFDENELHLLLDKHIENHPNIIFCGLMGMATFTEDENKVRSEFRSLKTLFERIKLKYFNGDENFTEISMGMSNDYKIAVEEGSTMIRVGSLIFGSR